MEFKSPLPAFYSYSHKDRRHLDKLVTALSRSRREKLINDWYDHKLRVGEMWNEQIIERALDARVFLLVLTNQFLHSDYCFVTELGIARARHDQQAAAVALILAEDADWEMEELKGFLVIRPDGKPVNETSPQSKAWTEVAVKVREMAEALVGGTYKWAQTSTLPPVPSLLPFTIGREIETSNFEKAFQAAPRQRPFICVLTGDRQGQNEFIETLLTDDGPVRNILNLSSSAYRLKIGGNVWVGGDDSVDALLTGFLISQVEPSPRSADLEGVAASLTTHSGLSIIHSELSATEWRARNDSLRFKQFLDYWASWPDLKAGDSLLVFLTIHAETEDFAVPGGLCLALSSVTRKAVEKWLTTAEARGKFQVDRVQERLVGVFGAQDRLPMDDFAAKVTPTLRKLRKL